MWVLDLIYIKCYMLKSREVNCSLSLGGLHILVQLLYAFHVYYAKVNYVQLFSSLHPHAFICFLSSYHACHALLFILHYSKPTGFCSSFPTLIYRDFNMKFFVLLWFCVHAPLCTCTLGGKILLETLNYPKTCANIE